MLTTFVLFLLIVVPITNLFHELGHILAAKIFRMDDLQIKLGIGPKIVVTSLLNIHIQINCLFFIGALSKTHSNTEIKSWKRSIISISGPIINIMIALLLFVQPFKTTLLDLAFLFNIWVGIINLLPFKIGDKQSDGYAFLKVFIK